MWANVVSQHKAVARGCQIPYTQITKFPGSWANYLTQPPRITWRVPVAQISRWVFAEHVEKEQVPATRSVVDDAVAGPSGQSTNDFQLPCGKSMNLYKYIKWLITTFGHSTRESLIEGALAAADTSTFERALTHPLFDSVCFKVFAVDKSLEVMQGFKARFEQIKWEKFEGNDAYLNVDASMRLIRHLLSHHEYSVESFVDDVWRILTLQLPKTNLLFVHGVPNSGKSYIIRSIAALYKYSATIQGTTSFPFMELAQSSMGLIEEPSFTDETLQTFKKLAEGTPTEVSVKNKGAARIGRIPLVITANYPFWKDGGALEKQAFASRMIEYKFQKPAGFLKMAKKPLNPGIWRQLFSKHAYPDTDDGSSSSDDELVDFLNVVQPEKKMRLAITAVDVDEITQEDIVLLELEQEK